MDLFEKFFGKIWTPGWKKEKNQASTVHVNQIKKYLEIVGQFCLPQMETLEVIPSRFYVGVAGQQLFLPEWIGFHDSCALNKNNYLYLVLKSCVSERLKLKGSSKDGSRRGQRLEFLRHMPEVNKTLDLLFPAFKDFEKDVFDSIESSNLLYIQDPIYRVWHSVVTSRESISEDNLKILNSKLQSNDEVPPYLFLTVPCMPRPQAVIDCEAQPTASENKSRKSEKEKVSGENVKKISLEDEKKDTNQVTHSFEKMETADDYQGGYRFDSGDDELESHSNALDEVELSQVTVDGEAAKSVYKAESSLLLQMGQSLAQNIESTAELYPEWSESKNAYFENHCRLLVHHQPDLDVNSKFKFELEKNNRSQIEIWRKKINKIVNEPLWRYRQKDGPEIDYDAAIRYLVDVHAGHSSEDRMYSFKKNQNKDISMLILFDQSYSTDSWVNNIRVLDTILGSIGMSGFLFEGIIENILVAGTWSATRHHCELQIYKESNESWDSFYLRAPRIEPKGYTRLGPAIRHAVKILNKQKTKRKILLLLTDGKPSDLDKYEGKHGIHDVKKACLEAEKKGILPFAIAIEKGQKSHLSTMFKHYSVVQSCEVFSEEVFKAIAFAIR